MSTMSVITVVGNLGNDAVEKVTPTGTKIISINIATSIGWGENKSTQWWRIALFGSRYEKLLQFLKKGTKIAVTGSLSRSPNVYTNKQGEQVVSPIEIVGDSISLLGSKSDDQGQESQKQQYEPQNDLPF